MPPRSPVGVWQAARATLEGEVAGVVPGNSEPAGAGPRLVLLPNGTLPPFDGPYPVPLPARFSAAIFP